MNTERFSERIRLKHSPGRLDVRSVTHGDADMHVALTARIGCMTADLYLLADEARVLADALRAAADTYQAMQEAA